MSERNERDVVDARRLGIAAAILLAVLIAVALVVGQLARDYRLARDQGPLDYRVPEAPRIDTRQAQEFAAYRDEQQRRLSAYGWVDRERGIVHVPIDRAVAMYLRAAGAPPP